MVPTNTMKEKATECSLRTACINILKTHKKPFSDVEIVRECMIQMAKILLDG